MIQSESDPLPPNPPYQPSAGLIGTNILMKSAIDACLDCKKTFIAPVLESRIVCEMPPEAMQIQTRTHADWLLTIMLYCFDYRLPSAVSESLVMQSVTCLLTTTMHKTRRITKIATITPFLGQLREDTVCCCA
jgi:hypothetical protein